MRIRIRERLPKICSQIQDQHFLISKVYFKLFLIRKFAFHPKFYNLGGKICYKFYPMKFIVSKTTGSLLSLSQTPSPAPHGKGKKPGWETAMNRNLAHLSLILVLTGRHLRIADNLTHKHTHTRGH